MNGVTIIICCFNSVKRLPETLNHLKSQVVSENIPWEVIVVDNASTDGTGDKAKELWGELPGVPFQVVHEPKQGLIHARITGYKSARYEFMSFIDDDNWIAPDWVSIVYEKMIQNPEVAVLGGSSTPVFESDPPPWFDQFQYGYGVGSQAESEGILPYGKILWGTGAHRRSAWKLIFDRGFSPVLIGRKGKKLLAGEDNEIAYMLLLAGWKFLYDPNLVFQHYIPSSRLNWRYVCRMSRGYGHAQIYIQHYLRIIKHRTIFRIKYLKEIVFDILCLLKHPIALFYGINFMKEGDLEVLKVNALIGQLEERVSQLHMMDHKIKLINSQTEPYLNKR